MRPITQNSIYTRVMLIVLAIVILVQPMLAASSPTIPERPQATDTLTASAERYITSLSEVARLSMALIGPIDAIRTTAPPQLPEAFVAQTRQQALDLASQSAIAIGAVDDFAADIEKLGGTLPAAIDIAQTAAAGLPLETKQDFQQVIGLSSTQITGIEQGLQQLSTSRFAIAQTGLPQDTQNQLIETGFSQADIGQITTTLANKGLVAPALPTRLEQFRATQWELSMLRMRALTLATQLLMPEMAARQAHGVAQQPASQADLTELANDELRLLTHIAALRSEWGNDPRLDRGEGQWWFIERYAQRAGERLEHLMLTTQNPAFAVDLLLLNQMHTVAITARSGDPAFVKPQLDHITDMLAFQLGNPVVSGRQVVEPTSAVDAPAAQVSEDELRADAALPINAAVRAQVVLVSYTRLGQAQAGGQIPEANEDNNSVAFIFPYVANTQVQLAPEVMAALEENFGHVDPAREKLIAWFWGVVTGQTDDWTALAGNFVFSLIPVLGIIPDLATLALEEGWFVKSLAVIGIIASIGDLVALIPVFAPVAAGSVAADAAAAGLKVAYHGTASVTKEIIRTIPTFEYAFTMAKGLTAAVGASFVKELKTIHDLPQVLMNAPGTCKQIWKSFLALVHYLRDGKLLKLKVTEGALWVGDLIERMVPRGGNLSDEGFEALIHISDDLGDAALRQSDEAGDALLDLANDLDEGTLRRLLDRTSCLVGAVADTPSHSVLAAVFAAPVAHAEANSLCDIALQGGRNLVTVLGKDRAKVVSDALDAALSGSKKEEILAIFQGLHDSSIKGFTKDEIWPGVAAQILERYASPDSANQLGKVLNGVNGVGVTEVADKILLIPTDRMSMLLQDFNLAEQGVLKDGIFAYANNIYNIRSSYQGVKFGSEAEFINAAERAVAEGLAREEGVTLLGIGDKGVRRALGMPQTGTQAADFLAVTTENTFILSDSKAALGGKQRPDRIQHAIDQLRATAEGLKNVFTGGVPQFERIEFVVPDLRLVDSPEYTVTATGILKDLSIGEEVRIAGVPVTVRVVPIP